MLLGNFEERSTVKSFVRTRKGKRSVVKTYSRKRRPKKTKSTASKVLKGTALGVAGLLGISAATYAGLKIRYVKNLDNIAKNLKVTKVHPPTNKSMLTFSIGGLGINGKPEATALKQSEAISRMLEKLSPDQELIPLSHSMGTSGLPETPKEYAAMILQQLSTPVLKGKSASTENVVQDIFNYAASNPGKPINVASFSAGGAISRDVDYILKKKGITAKFVTAGSPDFRFTPGDKSNFLNINSKQDLTYRVRSPGSKVVDVKDHHPISFYKNKEVRKLVKSFFYSPEA